MLWFHAGVSSCTTSSLSWCCTAACCHGLWPKQGSCCSAAEPQWCSNSADLPAVTSAYCETRSFYSGVNKPKLLYVLKRNCGVLLCSSYANLACVMTVTCLSLLVCFETLFRLWWLQSGLSFSPKYWFWQHVLKGCTDLLSLVSKCLDHKESDVVCISYKVVICIACSSLALCPSVLPIYIYVTYNLAQFGWFNL